MGIFCEAVIAPGSRSMADGSERLVLDLQELDREQWAQMYDLKQKKAVKVYLSTENITEESAVIVDDLELISDPSQVTKEYEVKELKFKAIKEIVNIYETTNSLILVIPHMDKIILTNKKDKNNLPHLRFSSALDVTVTNKKSVPIQPPKF